MSTQPVCEESPGGVPTKQVLSRVKRISWGGVKSGLAPCASTLFFLPAFYLYIYNPSFLSSSHSPLASILGILSTKPFQIQSLGGSLQQCTDLKMVLH